MKDYLHVYIAGFYRICARCIFRKGIFLPVKIHIEPSKLGVEYIFYRISREYNFKECLVVIL